MQSFKVKESMRFCLFVCLFLFFDKKINFDKEETEWKIKNLKHAFKETNLVLQPIRESWIKNETVMSWSSRKKKDYFFKVYFVLRKFLQHLHFISIYKYWKNFQNIYFLHIKKHYFIRFFAFFIILKSLRCILKIFHW